MSESPRAAIYTRISLAAMGDTTKTDEQERRCREICQQRGWEVADVFTDPSRSAWQRNRRRPGWEALLDGIRAGRFTAVVTYWGDRLVRQPRDLEDLLDLRDVSKVRVVSVAGQYDFDNPEHRMMMRWEVARACNESDTISRRTIAGHERRRLQGLTRAGGPGGRPYGFASDGVTQIPAEAELIREIARRILGGEGLGQLCRDLNDRRLPTVTGGEWQHGSLRKMIARPRLAGLMPDETPAKWEPVLDRGTWEQVRAVTEARGAGFGYTTNSRRYLLTGIATCGTCGRTVAIRHSTRSESLRGYGCINPECARKVHRKVEHADGFVTGHVIEILGGEAFAERRAAAAVQPGITAEIVELERLKEDARQKLENMADLPATVWESAARGMARYDEKIALLRGQLVAAPGERLARQYAGITRDRFEDLSLTERRTIVAALVSVKILPSRRRGPGFDPTAIDVKAKEGAEAN